MTSNDSFTNLSEKRTEINYNNCRLVGGVWIREKDVKEFIKVLKEEIKTFRGQRHHDGFVISVGNIKDLIDKLAGEELI